MAVRTRWAAVLGVVAVGGSVAAISQVTQQAQADPPVHLAYLRQRLQNFQTLWVRFEVPPTGGGELRTSGVLRIDAATGRLSIDRSSYRILWDGTHLWSHGRPDLPPARVGDAADAMMAAFMTELLAGLPNTTIIPPLQEDWGLGHRGWRLDLPFAWDDDYAILLGGRDDRDPTSLKIIVKQTKQPAKFKEMTLRLPLPEVQWDVRLLDDLSVPESLFSRQYRVSPPDDWHEVWEGPSMLPGYHVQTTTHAMWFDTDGSTGWMAGSTEIPGTRIDDILCTNAGQVVTAPIDLRYTLDPAAESSLFLQDAMTAGCPMTMRMQVAHGHHPKAGAKTRIQGTLRLRDTSTAPPTVLATRAFDETVTGPKADDRHRVLALDSVAPFTPSGLELTFQGTVGVQCVNATSEQSYVIFGMALEEPPTLAWTGCYPELGVVPDP